MRSSYVAVVNPKPAELARLRSECLSAESYAELRGVSLASLQ